MQEILGKGSTSNESENQIVKMIDRQFPGEDDIKKWALNLIKPFLLGLFNEPMYDYSQLIMQEAQRINGA